MAGGFRRNHYVPQWFQKRFILEGLPENKFYYLDLSPDSFVDGSGQARKRRETLRWGPAKCFKEEDLYTTFLGESASTLIEQQFFGEIDRKGKAAVSFFHSFEHPNANRQAFLDMVLYMSVQKLRTPKGLADLQQKTGSTDKNELLKNMQELRRFYCSIWTECVWVIADASNSDVKFILSDHPVTVYNSGSGYPETRWCRKRPDPEIWQSGTHTLFPLSSDRLLIMTNHSWVRNPYGDPLEDRPNPQPFRSAIFNFTDIQTGRSLKEDDVHKINFIIKKRAFRYIAAAHEEWLYPERYVPSQKWHRVASDYLLMPDPRNVKLTTSTGIGYSDGSAAVFDAYGRRPWQPDFQPNQIDENERKAYRRFCQEYARLYGEQLRGASFG